AIERHTSLDGATARERLKALIALYSERMNTEGMSIELAIRQWARSDELAANAVASVDAARLKNVRHLYRATGLQPEEADAQAFLFYCFVFGQSLLFLERGPRKRAQLVTKSAEKLLAIRVRRGRSIRPPRSPSGGAFQLLRAFAVIAAALLDPLQPAMGIGSLVGVVLIDTGVHAGLAGGLLGIFRIHRAWIDRGA